MSDLSDDDLVDVICLMHSAWYVRQPSCLLLDLLDVMDPQGYLTVAQLAAVMSRNCEDDAHHDRSWTTPLPRRMYDKLQDAHESRRDMAPVCVEYTLEKAKVLNECGQAGCIECAIGKISATPRVWDDALHALQ